MLLGRANALLPERCIMSQETQRKDRWHPGRSLPILPNAPLLTTAFCAAPQCPTRSGPIALALGYFENALGLVCPPRKDAGSFLQVRRGAGLALLGIC